MKTIILTISFITALLITGCSGGAGFPTSSQDENNPSGEYTNPIVPKSVEGKTFKTNQVDYFYFSASSTCKAYSLISSVIVTGTPTYRYSQAGQDRAMLEVEYSSTMNIGSNKSYFKHQYVFYLTFKDQFSGQYTGTDACQTTSTISPPSNSTRAINGSFTLR